MADQAVDAVETMLRAKLAVLLDGRIAAAQRYVDHLAEQSSEATEELDGLKALKETIGTAAAISPFVDRVFGVAGDDALRLTVKKRCAQVDALATDIKATEPQAPA